MLFLSSVIWRLLGQWDVSSGDTCNFFFYQTIWRILVCWCMSGVWSWHEIYFILTHGLTHSAVFVHVWCMCVALTCMRLTEQPGGAWSHHAILGGVEDGFWQWDGVSHHRPIQAVLCHDAAATPTLFPFPPLSPSVLEPDLENRSTDTKLSTSTLVTDAFMSAYCNA